MKPKVMFLITQSGWGGAQKYVFDVAVGLRNDFEVRVVCGAPQFQANIDLAASLERAGVEVIFLKNLKREIGWRDVAAFREIISVLKRERPDILFLHSTKAGLLGAVASFFTKINSVFTAHGFVFNEEPLSPWKRLSYRKLTILTSLFLKNIITVSYFDQQSGLRIGINSEKLITVHNGIGPINFVEKEGAQDFLKKIINCHFKRPVVITVSYFYRNKGLDYLIRAARYLDGCDFVIVGDGNERSNLESLINRYQLKNIFLTGEMKEPYRYLKAFDFFLLPSLKEGMPFVLLEAMAAGLPIVATSVGGVPEVIDDGFNGLLITPASEMAIVKAIKTLIENPSLAREFGKKAQFKIEEQFSLKKMLQRTSQILINLL